LSLDPSNQEPTMTAAPTAAPPGSERHTVTGARLLERMKELVHEGNVRRIVIRKDDGHPLLEVPLNVGVAGAALLPVWVAVGAIAALAANYTLEVERHPERV
jgi:hypothetical protein